MAIKFENVNETKMAHQKRDRKDQRKEGRIISNINEKIKNLPATASNHVYGKLKLSQVIALSVLDLKKAGVPVTRIFEYTNTQQI